MTGGCGVVGLRGSGECDCDEADDVECGADEAKLAECGGKLKCGGFMAGGYGC